MATKAQWFELYNQAGFRPIAVYKKTKIPVGEKWNCDWTADKWRPLFVRDIYDMGILLGDIVDVEGDTEESNELLQRMTESTPHPMFRSSKSTHHLFLNPDPTLTRKVFNGMEFRAYRHQSVVPPSLHEDGSKYGWLIGSKFIVPKIPDELLRYYELHKSKCRKKSQKLRDGSTQISCKKCQSKFFVHKKRLLLEIKAFQEHAMPWMCHKCREIDIRHSCRKIRSSIQKSLIFPVEANQIVF